MIFWRTRGWALFPVCLLVAWPARAQSQPGADADPAAQSGDRKIDVRAAHKATCAVAYEKAQEARIENRLLEAKRHLAICAQAQCPGFIRADCAKWVGEVEQTLPSVVISAVGADGAETTAVNVYVDGVLLSQGLDGAPIELDPGEHTFRFEHGTEEPLERKTLIRAGERNRAIEASWFAGKPTNWGAGTAEPGPLRPYAYVAGGVAAAGLISFGVFGILGRQQEKSVKEKCESNLANCPLTEIDQAETKLLVADVSLGVAAAGLLAGAALFVLSEPKEDGGVRVGFGVAPGAALANVSGSF